MFKGTSTHNTAKAHSTSTIPTLAGSHVKTRTLAEFIAVESERWASYHASVHVRSVAAPKMASLPINSKLVWSAGDRAPYATSADVIPHIVIPGMPAAAYPRYMSFLCKCTLATLQMVQPALCMDLKSAALLHVVALSVAVRCGVWSAMNVLPVADMAFVLSVARYDTKRNRLWMRASSGNSDDNAWLAAFDRCTARLSEEEALLQHVCTVSPIMMCMGATAATQRGEVYATPYVERSVSSCLKRRMGAAAYTALRMDLALTWDVMRSAAISGMPAAAVRCWAVDPLVAVGAQKRIAVTTAEMDRFSAHEEMLVAGLSDSVRLLGVDDDTAPGDDQEDPLVRQIREMKAERGVLTPDDDSITLPTEFGDADGVVDQDLEEYRAETVVPSRAASPEPVITQTQREQIRAAVQHAASMGQRAASENDFNRDDETVKW
jgi:hypothetical protein